jgi:hypothetical protein
MRVESGNRSARGTLYIEQSPSFRPPPSPLPLTEDSDSPATMKLSTNLENRK